MPLAHLHHFFKFTPSHFSLTTFGWLHSTTFNLYLFYSYFWDYNLRCASFWFMPTFRNTTVVSIKGLDILYIVSNDNFTVNYNDCYWNKTILRIILSVDYLLLVLRHLHAFACRYCDIQYLLNRIQFNWACFWQPVQISYTFALCC